MKRLWVLSLALCLPLPSVAFAAQTKIYPAPKQFSTTITPSTNDGAALGTASLSWSDLFLASGAVIDVGNGEIIITFAADSATLAGGQLVLPVGSNALPALKIGSAETGFSAQNDPGQIDVNSSGAIMMRFASSGLALYHNRISFGSGSDAFINREAAATFQFGDDAASPVAQTLKGPDGSGTDKAGGDRTSAPGRGTGTALGGNYYIATAPAGAGTGSSQNALVNRVAVSPTGVVGFSPQDVAATPVEPTTTHKIFSYNKSVADDGIVTLPAVTTNARGWITVGTGAATYASFLVGSTGTVTLLTEISGDVVANADTDAKLDIGTAATQEPLQIKNRLGSTQVINILFWYD